MEHTDRIKKLLAEGKRGEARQAHLDRVDEQLELATSEPIDLTDLTAANEAFVLYDIEQQERRLVPRAIEMYVGRVAPQDWYTIGVEIPADTPEAKTAEVAGRALQRILAKGDVHTAFWGVYQISGEDGALEEDLSERTGVFVTAQMDELIDLLTSAVEECLPDAVDGEQYEKDWPR
jgi:hypothetical protein